MQLKTVRKLYDGRELLSTPLGDQYWVAYPDGHRHQLSLQEAVKLLSEKVAPPEPEAPAPRRNTRSKRVAKRSATKDSVPKRSKTAPHLSRKEVEDAAQYLLLRDPGHHGEFRDFDGDLVAAIQQKADEIQSLLLNLTGSTHSREFSIIFYRGMAKLWRKYVTGKSTESA